MILVVRTADNRVMNDRQSADFGRKQKIIQLQEQLASLPPNASQTVTVQLQSLIAGIQAEYAQWKVRRINNVMLQFGGLTSDYVCVDVPAGEEAQALSASYITYDGKVFTYSQAAAYTLAGTKITVNPRWTKGNVTNAQDVTDFAGETLSADTNFKLCFYQVNADLSIGVELFTWLDTEDVADGNLSGKTFVQDICQGVIDASTNMIIVV